MGPGIGSSSGCAATGEPAVESTSAHEATAAKSRFMKSPLSCTPMNVRRYWEASAFIQSAALSPQRHFLLPGLEGTWF